MKNFHKFWSECFRIYELQTLQEIIICNRFKFTIVFMLPIPKSTKYIFFTPFSDQIFSRASVLCVLFSEFNFIFCSGRSGTCSGRRVNQIVQNKKMLCRFFWLRHHFLFVMIIYKVSLQVVNASELLKILKEYYFATYGGY